MHRKSSTRQLLVSAGILVGFLLVAGSLSQFELAPGLRFTPVRELAIESETGDSTSAPQGSGRFLNWLISLSAGLGVILFFVSLVRKESRSATIQIVIIGLVISGIFILITPDPSRQNDAQDGLGPSGGRYSTGSIVAREIETPDTAPAGEPRKFWSWSLLLIVPTIAGLILIARPQFARRRRESYELNELRTAATEAADAVAAAAETGIANVVVRCYERMLSILENTRSVYRERGMTAREFEVRLVQIGADSADVAGLTRLFEQYRYGAAIPTKGDQAVAEGYLRRIAAALGAEDA